jgi:gluconolactonase
VRHSIVTDGLEFPEGPVAMPNGDVVLVEIAGRRLTRVASDGTKTTIATVPGGPNGAAIGPDGACYICNNGGFAWTTTEEGFLRPGGVPDDYAGGSIQRIDLANGEIKTLYTHCDGRPLIGPNDLVFDHDGGLWFTDLGKTRARDMDLCGVYYCRLDDDFICEVAFPFLGANGIGLSPDDRTVYVAETPTGRLWAFDVLGPGKLAKADWRSMNGGRAVYTLPGIERADSLAVEAGGNICLATLRTGAITVVSPSGALIELIRFPDPLVTNICFGGEDMTTAWVTLSGTGRLARTSWERPGLKLAFG